MALHRRIGMSEGFDVGLEMSGSPQALRDMVANMSHGGKISDQGLAMAAISPEVLLILSSFNQLAGKLMYQKEVRGRLPKLGLLEIAKTLDASGYALKEYLQPAHWAKIGEYNKRHPRQPIKTFEAATKYAFSTHFVRKRLYVARDAYRRAFLDGD